MYTHSFVYLGTHCRALCTQWPSHVSPGKCRFRSTYTWALNHNTAGRIFITTKQYQPALLNHWVRVTDRCVGNITTIGSNNGLALTRQQAIIWTSAGILLIGPLVTNFIELLIDMHFHSRKYLLVLYTFYLVINNFIATPRLAQHYRFIVKNATKA